MAPRSDTAKSRPAKAPAGEQSSGWDTAFESFQLPQETPVKDAALAAAEMIWEEIEDEPGDVGVVVFYDVRLGHPNSTRMAWKADGVETLARHIGKGGEPAGVLIFDGQAVRARALPEFADKPGVARYLESLATTYRQARTMAQRPQDVWDDFQSRTRGCTYAFLVLALADGSTDHVSRNNAKPLRDLTRLMEAGADPIGYVTCRDGLVSGSLVWLHRDDEQARQLLVTVLRAYEPWVRAAGLRMADAEEQEAA